jgi:peptidoglycan/LPS O-acetylase OafA/YrhL
MTTIFWSLSLEEQFYLAFPSLILALPGQRLKVLLLAALALQAVIPRDSMAALFYFRLDAIIVGILIALTFRERTMPGRLRSLLEYRAIAAALVIAFLATMVYTPLATVYAFPLVASEMGCLVWLASRDVDYIFPTGRLKRAMMWLGARSYGVYLIRLPAMLIARTTIPGDAPASVLRAMLLIPVAVAILAALAELNFRLIENAARHFGRRLARSCASKLRPESHLEAMAESL